MRYIFIKIKKYKNNPFRVDFTYKKFSVCNKEQNVKLACMYP